MPFCIGLSAIFESDRTVHARTFLAAINHFINSHDTRGLTFIFEDDDASPEGGRGAARRLIARGADVVVGHFSSDAASAALPLYASSGIPVLLPAATKQDLVNEVTHAFRLCPSDNDLMTLLARQLLTHASIDSVLLTHDSTEHGESLARSLAALLEPSRLRITSSLDHAAALVYCGRLNNSIRYVNELPERLRDRPLYLTDDALSSWFIEQTAPRDTLGIVGLATAGPGLAAGETYYQESLAALQIARALSHCESLLDALQTTTFDTVMGDVQFRDGENRFTRAALWTVRNRRFIPFTSA
ncbi:ABC transporter substrate-binding protein [Pseudomonas citrulli]|uniref:ABC transporter substrate-binding protein n=1 Tax=Pseudomonas citrulli TaxID=3064347 RepID=A0ABT9BUE1_9PSED|nr:ABC transporter substrate-binding protein [Pseudomonas sp. K18]MDO7896183.1 ABC transporter substrate-binding protein [Pseudomonas sp. K18]